jgi:hypothetical protein
MFQIELDLHENLLLWICVDEIMFLWDDKNRGNSMGFPRFPLYSTHVKLQSQTPNKSVAIKREH